jgi:phosphatidylglycerol:prolipoprotein diacylglycerol transferase
MHYSKIEKISKEKSENIFFYLMIFSVIGGRLAEIIFYNPIYYISNPLKIFFVWEGGMSIHGGLIAGLLTLYYFSKKYKINFLKLTDIYSIPLSAALAFGRLANFINQELVGKVTTSKLGIVFPLYDKQTRWPYQIFAATKNMLIFQILYSQYIFNKLKPGMITAWFLILYNLGRFLIDFLREPTISIGIISMGQILSLGFATFGIYLLIKIKN